MIQASSLQCEIMNGEDVIRLLVLGCVSVCRPSRRQPGYGLLRFIPASASVLTIIRGYKETILRLKSSFVVERGGGPVSGRVMQSKAELVVIPVLTI
ncbi:hypothetical protein Pmani_011805 [Petrolisthes manimaculis]|uniref:Uncharacterized protein n=1 Tax=Petrolisthes manimaculis TaxID=1843537 RepID=A0AAE1Q274_9EUCA|nr:hypothetical protein Pmani_011805 [Petrolisthes manimaculis]